MKTNESFEELKLCSRLKLYLFFSKRSCNG